MLLPATLTACYALLALSIICFALWPISFQRTESQWRFELFSLDFSIGCILTAVIAAYTLGTLGSQLGFADSMLVAGRRAQISAVLAGMVFGFANICFLASITLTGLARAAIVSGGLLGFGLSLFHVGGSHTLLSISAALVSLAATLIVFFSKTKTQSIKTTPSRVGRKLAKPPMNPQTKGVIMAVIAGLAFASIVPLIGMFEPDDLGIGAYGGVLMSSIGILAATIPLSFFFFNIALVQNSVGFGNYLSGAVRHHLRGIIDGVFWTIGALAIYAASSGTVKLAHSETLLATAIGFLLAALVGIARASDKKGLPLAWGTLLAGSGLLFLAFRA